MKIAVVSSSNTTYSETFIRAHVDRLPGEVSHLYGGFFPIWEDGKQALPPRLAHLAARLVSVATGKDLRTVAPLVARQFPSFLRARALARYLHRKSFDVVLAEYGQMGVTIKEVTRRAGIPLVVHFHGFDAYKRDSFDSGEYREMFADAAGIIGVSRDMIRQLRSLGAPAEKLYLNPYGIDPGRFQPSGSWDEKDPELIAVGRFVEKKAPHTTLLAFSKVTEARPTTRLTMIGDGPLLDSCRSLVRALGIDDRVRFPGVLPHQEVARRMRASWCFVQHSITPASGDSEGTPLAVLEAGASGLPVVATRHAGIQDAVVHGETGFLVDEHDSETMAEYIVRVLDDPREAECLGKKGRERMLERYHIDDSIAKLHDILAGLEE